jgi:hypothetical protein
MVMLQRHHLEVRIQKGGKGVVVTDSDGQDTCMSTCIDLANTRT